MNAQAKVEATDNDGLTALHCAASRGKFEKIIIFCQNLKNHKFLLKFLKIINFFRRSSRLHWYVNWPLRSGSRCQGPKRKFPTFLCSHIRSCWMYFTGTKIWFYGFFKVFLGHLSFGRKHNTSKKVTFRQTGYLQTKKIS